MCSGQVQSNQWLVFGAFVFCVYNTSGNVSTLPKSGISRSFPQMRIPGKLWVIICDRDLRVSSFIKKNQKCSILAYGNKLTVHRL